MAILVLLETTEGSVRTASLSAVTAARELAVHRSGPVVGAVVGSGVGQATQDAARYVDKVLVLDDPGLAAPLAETWAPALVAAMKQAGADTLIATASSTGKDVVPRVTALVEGAMASDVVAVTGAASFRRPTYAGNVLTDVTVGKTPLVVTVRQTAFGAAAPSANVGTVEPVAVGKIDTLGAEIVSLHATKSARPDLSEASVVVSGGRGMRTAENFKVLEELTDLLGGALGASRAACDAGLVPNDLQVGQTGKVVAPKLYIAVAISGAIQHLAGMKGSKTIVAINKDPEAPIFQVADYGLVAEWEKAVPAFVAELKKSKG